LLVNIQRLGSQRATRNKLRQTIGSRTHGLLRIARKARDGRYETINTGPAAGLRLPRRLASAHYAEAPNELPVQQAIAAELRPGDVFFDVGANVGFFSLIASRIVSPTGTVVAFEPVPEIAHQLEANARINGLKNIRVLNMAVAERDGEMRLQLTAHPGGATLEGFGRPHDRTGTISVPARTLDSLIAIGEVPAPSVIKIDVEGAEAAVLVGATATLAKHHPALIYELDASTTSEIEAKAAEVGKLLHSAGYVTKPLPRSYSGEHLVLHFLAQRENS
jgi:FkbM family methyltransferase